MQKLKQIIEETDTKAGRYFDLFIQFLIIVSLASFSMETMPDLSQQTRNALYWVELVTVIIFTAEYILRVVVADKWHKFVFSFGAMVDLLAILPFYIASGIDLRSIRVLRLFRLLRVLKIMRYSKALKRLMKAFASIREEMTLFLVATSFVLYLAAVGIYYCESDVQPEAFGSVFHCLWWAVTTLTTVGYGDTFPITVMGKLFTTVVVLVGLGIVAIPSGLIASALTTIAEEEKKHKAGEPDS
jgi:voltage-gated potassium channel